CAGIGTAAGVSAGWSKPLAIYALYSYLTCAGNECSISSMAKRKRRKKRAGKPPPKCKAILLCEQTLVDEETERVTASDIFNVLSLPGFPTNAPPFTVFVQLVDGIGR